MKSTYRIVITQRGDAPELDGGTVELNGTVYGQFSEADAVGAALDELRAVGPVYQFRQHAVPADLFGGLRADLIAHEAAPE